ncbi:GntP family permease [Mitsuokella sp. oral taxon 131]|uniref:GntP family permease n=1 Tax=Mitsuokella sp. oral taxon 131 TaxID=1321780 RepID=UPI0003ADD315|nr:GntP family permease [Mitsuokella sp. oral taxon 131]ERL03683.1 transporter, gluconate:H+ symporter family [Mitsuokella sp. oral taxon 131 str. W9106]
MAAETQILIGLGVGIACLIFMIMKTKIHTFLALILATVLVGVIGGIEFKQIVASITKGFGGTLGSIGIIIGFGVMMGQLFEVSGAAKRMALCFLKLFGKGREEIAMALTGFLVSIPIFCDSGFVILTPLAKAISTEARKSIVSIGIALATGLVITHTMVPPTPGPVGVAGIFEVSVGSLILWGLVLSVPMLIGPLLFAKWAGERIWQIPTADGGWTRDRSYTASNQGSSIYDDAHLPSAFISFAPIVVPILLILIGTVASAMGMKGQAADAIQFFGTPVIAVGIGLLLTIYGLTGNLDRKRVLEEMETGIKSAGIIILITGGGGAFGMLIRDSGVGTVLAETMLQTSIPAILLPFFIATIVRFIQGSGTVAMITAASITAPIIANLSVNPVFAALAACVGSLFYSYFNDSFFWVVNRSIGITEGKEQLRLYSVASTIAWATGIIVLLILNAMFG